MTFDFRRLTDFMKVFHDLNNANILRPTCLTLGVFDGLHLGHQAIMKTVVDRAEATNTTPTVITFDPHPRSVLTPEYAPPLLQTLDQRLAAFEFLGIKSPVRNEILKPFFAELKEMDTKEWMTVVDQLWNQKFREFQYAAMVFTDRKIKDLQPDHLPFL